MAGLLLFCHVAIALSLLLLLEVKGLDHGGSDIYVTFLPFVAYDQNRGSDFYSEVKLYITTPERVPVTFTISAPGTGYFHRATVDPGGVKEFIFSGKDYALRNTVDRSKGIIITVENEKQIFVYAAKDIYKTTDSFLVLPPHDLGAESYTYMAVMIHTLNSGYFGRNHGEKDVHALVGIVSVDQDTQLTITPTRNVTIGAESVKAGESVIVTLNRAETLLIAFVGDLTGTKVTSNRPISFFCGDQCTNIPRGVGGCDQIVEQFPPVEAWGRQFATAPLKTRMSFDVFRIVASENKTFVTIRCTHRSGTQGYVDTFTLSEGDFADVRVSSTEFCWMEADKNILLLQFATGSRADSVLADPFMALVPAVSHYTNSFTLPIVNSSLNNFTHYLNIIIPAEHYQTDQIFMDGQSLQSLAIEFVDIVRNGETMAYASQVEVSATTHTLIHGNSRGLFGVVSYGFARYVSYGHVGGMQFPQFMKEHLVPTIELTVLEITSTSFTVSWRPPQGDLRDVSALYYLINVTDMEGKNVVLLRKEVNSTIPHFRVAELFPDHVHQVSVAAVLGEKVGPSATLFVKTGPVAITLQPMISSVVTNATEAMIKWEVLHATLNVSGYDIRVLHQAGDTTPQGLFSVPITAGHYQLYQVRGLMPETVYSFQVRARTAVSTTQWSTPVVRSTLPTAPPGINRFTPSSLTSTSIALSWDKTNAAIEYYKLTLHNVEANTTEHSDLDLFHTASSHTFHDLSPNTAYSVSITAVNKGKSGPTVSLNVTTQGAPVPPHIDGFTASSPTPTSIALSWLQSTAAFDHYKLTLRNMEANTAKHSDLFHTVNSHTFHNLSPNTAYSVSITAVNMGKNGPTVSVNVTTQGAPVSPLAITTGALGAMVVIGIVAVLLLIGCTCCMWVSRKKGKDHAASEGNYNCELQENVAYVTAAHNCNKQWSEACCNMEEEEERYEEDSVSVNGEAAELEPASPKVPCRQYLQEKEKGQTMFASIPVFDEIDFKKKSGWYKPTVADVISRKLGMDVAVFADLGPGVYFMCHRAKKQAKWVGFSPDLCRTLCGLFFQLYQKERSELSPLEVELKFFSPLAADWDIRVWAADPKELALERAKKVVEFKTLKPLGLNNALKFTTKEMWEEFISWCAAQRRNK